MKLKELVRMLEGELEEFGDHDVVTYFDIATPKMPFGASKLIILENGNEKKTLRWENSSY